MADFVIPEEIEENSTPTSFDWRDTANVVNPVQNQGQCGSCWAFSAVATAESRFAIKHSHLFKLAEQELVDCESDSHGCHGGWPELALKFMQVHAPVLEETCPYVGKETDTCCWNPTMLWKDFKISKVETKISKFWNKGKTVDTALMRKEIATNGPVSSAVAVNKDFQFYSSGVLKVDKCPASQMNHAVVTVG